MAKPLAYASLLLISTALVGPGAFAQTAGGETPASPAGAVPQASTATPAEGAEEAQEAPDVSIPGGEEDIVVRGRAFTEPAQTSSQVLTVLSTADIARTGEGDIAGALGRTTGLSVVGNGFVYVRGLGDRYSLALLNGSPLPSPEPLKRVVPLDIFPTDIVASALVQKSFSANFPGEFGGGVINLTTKSIPTESFITLGAGIGYDTYTTGQLGYTYFGSDSDWTGFDDGSRDRPPALQAYLASGRRISEGGVNTGAIAEQLVSARNAVVFRNNEIPVNWSAALSGGHSFEVGDALLGVIASFSYGNTWRTRQTTQQTPANIDLSQLESDFDRVITDNRIVANALVGYGLEFGDNKVRWTNVYIRDTLKQARLGLGTRQTRAPEADFLEQNTAWFERQLVSTQIAAELKPLDGFDVDIRAGYANSQREAPYELDFEYFRSNATTDPFRDVFINRLNNGQQGRAQVAFSDLNEDLWSSGVDLSYRFNPDLRVSAGYAFTDTQRRTERRDFLFLAPGGGLPQGPAALRPDLLISRSPINFFGITLVDANEGNPVFDANLRTHAGYVQASVQVTPEVNFNVGVRYEDAKQTVNPVQVFLTPTASLASTNLARDYFLPTATMTYQIGEDMQFRLSASKTIARPQFRELIFQQYFDPDVNRNFFGNPLLVDSQLYNFEGRYEWYFAREQRLSAAAFFKRIDNPIETFVIANETGVQSSFANAPSAILYGGEFELRKFFNLDNSSSPFFQRRRIVLIGNYTYTQSELRVSASDPARVFNQSANRATDYFRDGAPLTGQSDHLLNLEIGLEDRDALSQQTFLISWASKRVTNRGAFGQPDIVERPGVMVDFVARQGITLAGVSSELKFEVRNILGQDYREFQRNGDNTVFYNLFDRGTIFNLGWSFTF
jgi:outer membrane receptor protein involved in Fe transport